PQTLVQATGGCLVCPTPRSLPTADRVCARALASLSDQSDRCGILSLARRTTLMKRTEWTARGLATYHSPDFRTYEPEWAESEQGDLVQLQQCEEWVEGRWEGFCSELARMDRPSAN